LAAVKLPYLGIAAVVLLWALLVGIARFPPIARRVAADQSAGSGGFRALFGFPRYWLGVLAQFAYVGAQVGVWSFIIRYTQFNFPDMDDQSAGVYLVATHILFFGGRFIGTLLMSRFSPVAMLVTFALIDVALCATGAFVGGTIGLYALVATSFFMSIQF